jgi:hypothetical protein
VLASLAGYVLAAAIAQTSRACICFHFASGEYAAAHFSGPGKKTRTRSFWHWRAANWCTTDPLLDGSTVGVNKGDLLRQNLRETTDLSGGTLLWRLMHSVMSDLNIIWRSRQ